MRILGNVHAFEALVIITLMGVSVFAAGGGAQCGIFAGAYGGVARLQRHPDGSRLLSIPEPRSVHDTSQSAAGDVGHTAADIIDKNAPVKFSPEAAFI